MQYTMLIFGPLWGTRITFLFLKETKIKMAWRKCWCFLFAFYLFTATWLIRINNSVCFWRHTISTNRHLYKFVVRSAFDYLNQMLIDDVTSEIMPGSMPTHHSNIDCSFARQIESGHVLLKLLPRYTNPVVSHRVVQ